MVHNAKLRMQGPRFIVNSLLQNVEGESCNIPYQTEKDTKEKDRSLSSSFVRMQQFSLWKNGYVGAAFSREKSWQDATHTGLGLQGSFVMRVAGLDERWSSILVLTFTLKSVKVLPFLNGHLHSVCNIF
jgi:hypothetical protein